MDQIDERTALSASIRQLKHLQLLMGTLMDESVMEDESHIKEYFDSPFDSEDSRKFENAVIVAMTASVYSSEAIPPFAKEGVARRRAHSAVEMLRLSKLDYQDATEKITSRQYKKLFKENDAAQRLTNVKKTARFIRRKGLKIGISAGLGLLASAISPVLAVPVVTGLVTYGVLTLGSKLIPKSIREPIKKKMDTIQKKVLDVAVDANRWLANKLQPVAEKVAPVIQKTNDVIHKIGASIKAEAEKAWAAAKRGLAKLKFWK